MALFKMWSRPKRLIPVDPKDVDPLFYRLITLCTPYGHEDWIVSVIQRLPFFKKHKSQILGGNLLIQVGEAAPTTLFSAHMDIVGDITKKNKEIGTIDLLTLMEDAENPEYFFGAKRILSSKEDTIEYSPSTLGADDKVGVFILLKMIQKEIPGLYVFHVGEERGGIGSAFLANNHADIFTGIKRAIAYDRAGYTDIIGRQRGQVCCSKIFMNALAEELNKNVPPLGKFTTDITGSFTDTASYMNIIPECTNISAGYFNQHGVTEYCDWVWIRDTLLVTALAVDYESLPTSRDPKVKEKPVTHYYHYSDDYSDLPYYSKGKTTWKTVTKHTPTYLLPNWDFQDGYVDGVDNDILRKVITWKIENMGISSAVREKIGKEYFNLLHYCHVLEEEVQAQQIQIEMMEKSLDDPKVSDEELAEIAKKLKEGNKVVQLKLLEAPKPDIYIFDKKHLMMRLIEMCKSFRFDEPIGDYPPKYARRVENFLNDVSNRTTKGEFSHNKIKKMNGYIFNMTYWIVNKAIGMTNLDKDFMNSVFLYIEEHKEEKGWLGSGGSFKPQKEETVIQIGAK